MGDAKSRHPLWPMGWSTLVTETCSMVLNATNGAQLWTAGTAGFVSFSPTVANGVVYVGSEDHKLSYVPMP